MYIQLCNQALIDGFTHSFDYKPYRSPIDSSVATSFTKRVNLDLYALCIFKNGDTILLKNRQLAEVKYHDES